MGVAFRLSSTASSTAPEAQAPRSGDRAGTLSASPAPSCPAATTTAGAISDRACAAHRLGVFGQASLLIALAMLLFGALALPLYAADTITGIEIRGNRTVDADLVRSHVKLARGEPYDAAKVSQSIKALFATGLFAHVTIERRGASLLVTVAEKAGAAPFNRHMRKEARGEQRLDGLADLGGVVGLSSCQLDMRAHEVRVHRAIASDLDASDGIGGVKRQGECAEEQHRQSDQQRGLAKDAKAMRRAGPIGNCACR